MSTSFIRKAVEACGSQAELARRVEVSQQMVWQWVDGRRPVPPKHCIPIEVATVGTVTRHDLRPDIFGPVPSADAQQVA